MEKKIRSCIREKGLLDLMDVVIDPLFIKEIIAYPNIGKLKPPPIDPYDGTKDHIDHVQKFQSQMHYVGAYDAIMCCTFLTIFYLVA